MNSQDLAVLNQVQQWLHLGQSVLLVTVVKTWGASPRPVGALLAISQEGLLAGSVSGGCIEDDLLHRLKQAGMPSESSVVTYGETAEEARRLGLPCGGSMQLVLEPFTTPNALDEVLLQLDRGQVVKRILDCETGKARVTASENPAATTGFKQPLLTSVYGPRYRLLLIGAGEISQLLAEVAISLDFAVTVCDPRPQYADLWQVANTQLTREMPDDVVINMQPDERTAIVTLTHDPKLDDLALIDALQSSAFYVAALGSTKANQARKVRLSAFDVTKEQLAKLHGPAGLSIGSKTPSEIAVSIAAQLVAVKHHPLKAAL